jgi:hypothetical protein
MGIYLFYLLREVGPASFEAFELGDDATALAWAPRLFDDHASCTSVEVWEGERCVGTIPRGQSSPSARKIASMPACTSA